MTDYRKIQRQDEYIFICNMVHLREKRHWTQQRMCSEIDHGLKFKTYQSWEERRAFPPIFFCRRIAELFSVDLKVMLTERLFMKDAA